MKNAQKTALVTGATGGLGQAVVQAFLQQGASVIAIARHPNENILPKDEKLSFAAADVTREEDVQAVMDRIRSIDFFIHCAGGFRGGQPLWQTEVSAWDGMMDLNLRSAFLISRTVMKKMAEQQHGKIVFVTAMSVFNPAPNRAAYIVAKAGLVALTQALALEGKAIRVQVNAIAPSIIRTAANKTAMPDMDASKWVAPQDIAATILFLCSPDADDITGTVIKMPGKM
jgi:NAD(P)-dependent dehydrogenase (short-subunit alcohol dehydrogenase family)